VVKAGLILCTAMLAASISFSRWEEIATLPTPLAGGYGFADHDQVMYAGGSTWRNGVKEYRADVHVYDGKLLQWRSMPSLPLALAYGAAVMTSQGPEILGGVNGDRVSRQILRFEPKSNGWREFGMLPADSLLSRAEVVGDEVLLFGGCQDLADLTGCSDAVWSRDLHGKWKRVASLPHGPLAVAASAVLGRSVYLFGGCSMPRAGEVVNHDEAWKFDMSTHQWKQLRSMPHAARSLAAIALDDHRVLLAGGYHGDFSAAVLIYDATLDRYSEAPSLPLAAANVTLIRSMNKIFSLGGEDRMKCRTPRAFTAILN